MQDALQGNERGLVSDPQGLDLDEKPKRSPPDFQKNKQSNIRRGGICAPSAKHGIVPTSFFFAQLRKI